MPLPAAAADGWEAPDFRKAWQGGLTNEELEQWWRLKLPHVEATNRDICVFALGVEVGAGMGEAPKPDTALAASPAVQEAQPSMTQRLQQRCSDWGVYWRSAAQPHCQPHGTGELSSRPRPNRI